MAIIDYIFIGAVVIALIVGLVKGVLSMVIDLAGLILGLFVAGQFATLVSGWMVSFIEAESTRYLVAYIVCLLVTIIVVSIIGKAIKKLISNVKMLKTADTVLGMVVSIGLVYAIFGFIFAIMAIDTTEIPMVGSLLQAIGGFTGDSTLAIYVYGDSNVVGNWLLSLLSIG